MNNFLAIDDNRKRNQGGNHHVTYEDPIDSTAVPSHARHFLLYSGVDAEAHNVVAGPQLVN